MPGPETVGPVSIGKPYIILTTIQVNSTWPSQTSDINKDVA